MFLHQIDYLQQKNKDLEKRLDDAIQTEVLARKQAASADQEKTNLTHSLREADRTARRLEEDRKAVISAADKELADAKLELSKNRNELERLDMEVAQLRAEADRLSDENHKLSSKLAYYYYPISTHNKPETRTCIEIIVVAGCSFS